ncbi:MAG: hypothetical protein KA004_14775 [Verrucomicrobiales bacterium]|nr:hypothetical protein [Verrucomicrobiales bacterium]
MTLSLKATAAASLSLVASLVQADLLYYEPFDYTPGEDALKGAGRFLNEVNAGASGDIVGSTLEYRDAVGNALRVSGNHAHIDTSEEAAQVDNSGPISLVELDPEHAGINVRWFSMIGEQTAGTNARFIGLSFRAPDNTYKPNDGGSNTDEILNMGMNSMQSPQCWRIADRALTNNGQFANSGTPTTVRSFVVVKMELNVDGGSLERYTLWVNPLLNAEPDPATGFTFLSPDSDISQWSDINLIRLASGYQNANGPSSSWLVDEIRIGESWSDVSPYEEGFRVESVMPMSEGRIKLTWVTKPGRVDVVEWSADLQTWNPINESAILGAEQPALTEYTATPPVGSPHFFLRLRRIPD